MNLLAICSSLCCGLTAMLVAQGLCSPDEPGWWSRYRKYIMSIARDPGLSQALSWIPFLQAGTVFGLALLSLLAGQLWSLAAAGAVVAIPPLYVRRYQRRRRLLLEAQLDGLITGWAGALTASPNLGEALQSLTTHLAVPWKEEIELVLRETELGLSLEQALNRMVERLKIPGLDTVVLAAQIGKRTGGDLPGMLSSIATSLREMNRLHGVLRTRTAEGRNQAWVIGAMPLVLILVLQGLNPGWLAPLWDDPVGWAILAAAGVLEVTAVLLVRKIMNVEI